MKAVKSYQQLRLFLLDLPIRKNKKVQKARRFWVNFLYSAPQSQEEWAQAAEYAASWTLCACGSTLPRELRLNHHINQEPEDDDLYQLGIDFCEAIENRDYTYARQTFKAIQIREAELLRELAIENPSYN